MREQIEKARQAGYSDSEITQFLSQKDPRVNTAIESGYKPEEVIQFLSKPAKNFGDKGKIIGGKIGRAIEAGVEKPSLLASEFPTAVLKTAEGLASLHDPIGGALEKYLGKQKVQPSDISSEYLRKDLAPELHQGAEDIADIESFLLPIPALGKAKGVSKVPKKPDAIQKIYKERAAFQPKVEKWVPDAFESGLSKPGAVGAKKPGYGLITKERQKEAINKLDNEAQNLIKGRVSERIPVSKKIAEGFDFDKYHAEEFGKLKHAAEKANPDIEINPLTEFFSDTRSKYRGIPNPHADAKSVLREMNAFRKTVPSELKDLLKIRRSNSQKLNAIYDQRLLKGKRHEYADFLNNMNRKIDESIEKTLPEGSPWVKKFKELNSEFRDYKRGQETISMLEPIMREKMSTTALTRLAEDPKKQKLLQIKMGEEGAQEIIQIAKDLKTAREAIKSIPVKELAKYDSIWPVSWIFKPLGIFKTVQKGYEYTRRAYGHLLSSPAKRKVFDEMLHAVAEKDLGAYEKAANHLKD